MRQKEFTRSYTMTAADCGPESVMTPQFLAAMVIEVATLHANQLGVGYDRLMLDGMTWVLSRLSLDMTRWPGINEVFTVTTWIEGVNRHFSERNFEICTADGEVLGYARSVWMGIRVRERSGGDLSLLESLRDVVSEKRCPVPPVPRLRAMPDDAVSTGYTFTYCDCDFNRHVNTVRYIELLLNRGSLDFYDTCQVSRLDIAFMHEARCGEEVTVEVAAEDNDSVWQCAVKHGDTVLTRAMIQFRKHIFNV